MLTHTLERSSFLSRLVGHAARSLAVLAGAALLVTAVGGHAASLEALGVGDSIRVTVFQNPDLTTETRISQHGSIMFPLIGEVKIAGTTPTGAAKRIADALKHGKFMRNPQVTVAVLEIRSHQVSVLGEVVKPGRYPLDTTTSRLTDVLALAGGISPGGGDVVTVMLTRHGKVQKITVDVPAMYRSGDMSSNVQVQSGDTIFVQRAPVFYIYGEVQRAGAYRLEPNMAVMQAISLGGGLTPRGTDSGLTIKRRMPDGKVRTIDAKLATAVEPNDVIYVKESWF